MPEHTLHLLFVRIEHPSRSQMAEGFARSLGRGRAKACSAVARS